LSLFQRTKNEHLKLSNGRGGSLWPRPKTLLWAGAPSAKKKSFEKEAVGTKGAGRKKNIGVNKLGSGIEESEGAHVKI